MFYSSYFYVPLFPASKYSAFSIAQSTPLIVGRNVLENLITLNGCLFSGGPQPGYGDPYSVPPPPGGYGSQPYGQPGYGAPPPSGGYGAPPPSGGYGAPPPSGGYGAPPPSGGYGGAPPPGGYGAQPPAAGYGAHPGYGSQQPPQQSYASQGALKNLMYFFI